MSILHKVAICVVIATCCSRAEEHGPSREKSDGGLLISWEVVSSDPAAYQVKISDGDERPLTSLKVLGTVADAKRVSIYDVSARANLIAVAAVYESKKGNRRVRPTATLLLFDLNGQLMSVLALEPSHQIALLAIDDDSNIWTLTDHADTNVDPSTVPMVVKYTAKGEVVQELLKRSMFPLHASDLKQDIEIGGPAMGYEAGVVWFWLPGSTDLVTISTSDSKITRKTTQLPKTTGYNAMPLSIRHEPSGNLVAQVGENYGQGGRRSVYYRWSQQSASWAQFKPAPCEGGSLIGAADDGQVYRLHQAGRHLCKFREF